MSFGVFWLSLWPVGLFTFLFDKLTGRIIYGDGLLNGIAMGVLTSMGRALAAIFAGIFVTVAVAGRKSERWAFIVAALYVVDAPVHFYWHLPPTAFERLWQSVNLFFPVIACIAAAAITARLRRKIGVWRKLDRIIECEEKRRK